MKNRMTTWLLAGVAATTLNTAAHADELSTLKAQLEALQSRVDTMATAPASAFEGKSLLTFERGHGSNTWGTDGATEVTSSQDSGFTIAVTPTADMPAPVAEITVYGYVNAHVAYDFDTNHGDAYSFDISELDGNAANDTGDHIGLTAARSRFGIRSKVDTAIGQIRTRIELDFATGGNSGSLSPRMRKAFGEWDMTPNWTFLAGQTDFTAGLLPIGVSTVDAAGPLLTFSRTSQVRLTYADGPLSWAVAIENPHIDSTTNMPNIASYLQYDIAGGHQFIITGEVADWSNNGGSGHQDELAWAIQAGVNFNLADVATLTAGVGYGEGLLDDKFMGDIIDNGVAGRSVNAAGDPLETLGFLVGLSFGLSDTTTFNTMFSYAENLDGNPRAGQLDKAYVVHANVMWQPVKQMRMGWEVVWAEKDFDDGTTEDGVRATFGTWFFF
jgi:hypothetical protein